MKNLTSLFAGGKGGHKKKNGNDDHLKVLPGVVWRIFAATEDLFSLVQDSATVWTHSIVEMYLWDYSYCPNAGIEWPATWPDASGSPVVVGQNKIFRQEGRPYMCVERKSSVQGRAFSVMLPATELVEAQKIAKRLREEDRMCVVFHGIKYSAMMRFPMPGEKYWKGQECPSAMLPASVFDQPTPILVLEMPNPWAMVMGAEAPLLIVYSNGAAILAGSKTLSLDEGIAPWKKLLGLLRNAAESSSSISYCTDQTCFRWIFWERPGDDSSKKTISVYGDLREYVEAHPIPKEILESESL